MILFFSYSFHWAQHFHSSLGLIFWSDTYFPVNTINYLNNGIKMRDYYEKALFDDRFACNRLEIVELKLTGYFINSIKTRFCRSQMARVTST